MAVYLHIAAGTPEIGLWCDLCLLPSRIRVPVRVLAESGVSEIGYQDYCKECGD